MQEETTEEISHVDGEMILDQHHGCVTLFNAADSEALPYTWMGHATLDIETIERGGYFARVAHLIKSKDGKRGLVKFFEINREDIERRKEKGAKTETCRRPKKDIQRMLDQIFFEVTSQRKGNPLISFSLDGSKINFRTIVLLMAAPELLGKARAYRRDPTSYNCIEYAMRNLLIASIEDDSKEKYVWSKHLLPSPVQYTGSRSKAIAGEITALSLRAAVFTGFTMNY